MYNQLDLFGGETAVKTKEMSYTNIPHFSVELVREKTSKLAHLARITTPDHVHAHMEVIFSLSGKPQEHLVMLALSTKNDIIGAFTIHIGTVNASMCCVRDIFQRALLANASSVIIAHNHPSGDTTPSKEDIAVTERIQEAGKILGIELLDHIIIGDDCHLSLKAEGYMS